VGKVNNSREFIAFFSRSENYAPENQSGAELWTPLHKSLDDRTPGGLGRTMRLWCQKRMGFAVGLLVEHACWHPLLLAVHSRDVNRVAFFIAVGCSPLRKGTSPLLSGDELSSSD